MRCQVSSFIERVGGYFQPKIESRVSVITAVVAITLASCGGDRDSDSTQPSNGWLATGIGDVDGDGCGDLALSMRFHPVTESDDFATWIVSGREGEPLYTVRRNRAQVDRLRTPDFGIHTPAAYLVHPLVDQNGDQLADVCISLDYRDEQLVFLAGNEGRKIMGTYEHWRSSHPSQGQHFPLGDVDGDGLIDYLDNIPVRSMDERPTGVEVFSGKTFQRLFTCQVDPRCDYLASFHPVGDLNGDSFADFSLTGNVAMVVEDRRCKPSFGVVTIHSGRDGSLIRTYDRDALRTLAALAVPNVVVP